MSNDPTNLLHAAAGNTGMRCYGCPACRATLLTTEPINMMFLCTLCEEVLVERTLGGVIDD